jgi:signal transduction histidine kinase/CheY-like chemotaxis protein
MITGNSAEAPPAESEARTGRGGEEMESRIREFDWSKTPLGPLKRWPQSLRTVVNILLSSRYSMWMAWGPELTFFYNDAYRPTLGVKHPQALGMRSDQVWPEIWHAIGPLIETVLKTGKATYEEGLMLFLERSGFPEETYHTFSYSPLTDDDGRISGMLCVVTEETERLIGERRVETLREVASALGSINTEDEVLATLSQQLSRNRKDLPFTLTYLFEGDAGAARLASSSGMGGVHALAPARIEAGTDSPWPAQRIFLHPATRIVEDLAARGAPGGDWSRPTQQAAIVPIRQQGQEQPAGFFVAGLNPYRRFDTAYSGFVDLLGGQIAAALANARAREAERRRAEALAEIDRAKTTFFSNVSHELRTPLTLMLSPVEELLANGAAEKRELLELIHRNGLRLQKLVNTLLDFSRIEAGRMQPALEATDLDRYTSELAANFRPVMQSAGLDFRIDCEPLAEAVYVDREMWEKIVLNLLSNALKFTFQGSVRVGLKAVGGQVELTVEDTGTGIPASELPHIFERFHRVAGAKGRTIEGTGIGLALVQELAKLHGGSARAESEVAKGTKFTVTIPFGPGRPIGSGLRTELDGATGKSGVPLSRPDTFADEARRWVPDGTAGLPAAEAGTAEANGCQEKILLADDNADMREYVARLLAGRYQVRAVADGTEALRQALAEPYDLILSDVMMPGLDGFALLKELRAHTQTRTVPVVLLSARAGEESRVDGLGAGADDYLIKPFTARELLARVAAHLAMRRRSREAGEALRESQATLQSFYDSSPFFMGVMEIEDEDILPVHYNSATAKFLGGGEDNAKSIPEHTVLELGVPAAIHALWLKHYRESQAEGRPVRFEYKYPLAEGALWFSGCVNFLGEGPAGRPRFSFVAEDITERKKNEELVRQSNEELRRANADLEQFAYSASHDLQEPLRQIAVYSQLFEKRYAGTLDAQASEYLGYCIEGAHRMEMLISGLLTYSQVARTPDSPAQPVSIGEVIESVRKNLATAIEESGAEITASDLPVVQGDSIPLVLLFQNLISNALKYRSEDRPRISITARADSEDPDRWRFAVADNGIGIPKQYQAQIFGMFKRLHGRKEYPGTGIGLAICQKIVERYGGQIGVESEPGIGSTFFFTLRRGEE